MSVFNLAIVALEVRLPGAESLSELSDFIHSDRTTITSYPAARSVSDRIHTQCTRQGSFLPDVFSFDHQAFNLTEEEAIFLDPQQRIMMEVAGKALDQAGLSIQANRDNVGVFIGARMNSYGFNYNKEQCSNEQKPISSQAPSAPLWGRSQNFIAAWIADRFNLAGPAMVVDTACSSSLSALWVAAQAIANNNCKAALVGGVDLLLDSLTFDLLEDASALSDTGYCRPLDRRADGYLPGEGAIALVLKPVDLARQDGDTILAHLSQICCNNDGATMGVTTPNVVAQQELIQQAYKSGDGEHLEYVELHGTGTTIGDPIEVDALNRGLLAAHVPKHQIDIGSIKQQTGHLHSASGLAGLAKIVAIAQTRRIPVSAVREPNPRLNLDKTYFQLANQARELIHDDTSLAVSSFGFGGTNVHAVIRLSKEFESSDMEELPLVLPLSAPSPAGLRDLTAQWVEQLTTSTPKEVARMCATARRKKHWNHRIAVIADNPQKLAILLTERLYRVKQEQTSQFRFIRLNPTRNGEMIQCMDFLKEVDSNVSILVDQLTELTGMNLNELTNDLLSFAELCFQAKVLTDLGFPLAYLRFPTGCAAIGDFIANRKSLLDTLNTVATYNDLGSNERFGEEDLCIDMSDFISKFESSHDVRLWIAVMMGIAYEAGVDINWRKFYNKTESALPIPHYPSDGRTFDISERSRGDASGMEIKIISQEPELIMEATLHARLNFIAQHLIYGVNVLPGVAWFGIIQDMLEHAGRHYHAYENVRFLSPLVPMPATRILCSIDTSDHITIYNAENGQKYFSATLIENAESDPEPTNLQDLLSTTGILCSGTSTYRWLRKCGYSHGRYYRNISFIAETGADQTIARLESSRYSAGLHTLNPGLLDSMTISAIDPNRILESKDPETIIVPFSIGSVRFYRRLADTIFVHTKVLSRNDQGYRITQTLLTEEGEVVALFTNLTSKSITYDKLEKSISSNTTNDTTFSQGMNEIEKETDIEEPENIDVIQPSSENVVWKNDSEPDKDPLLQFIRQANLSIEDVDREFLETGFDSMGLVELSDRLAEKWSLPLYPTIFFEFPTPRAFVEGFLKKQQFDLQRKAVEAEQTRCSVPIRQSDIAIVGLSFDLPGTDNGDTYWEQLYRKEVKISLPPKTRQGWECALRETAVGAYLAQVDGFDPSIFRISPREAALIDPQARVLYEHIWKALENAGIQPIGEKAGRVGLWVAYSHDHYYEERLRLEIREGRGLGGEAMVANRLSFALDWHGPSQIVNTLCSSSLVAIHEAVHALRRKEVDVAVVGGVNLAISPNYYISMQGMGVFSSNGRCRSFDATADGTLPGEGAVCVVLRRYDESIVRGEPVLAILKGTAIGHGGLSTRYSAPNPNAQAAVISAALKDAKVDADTIGLVEAHGTGTVLGDPIEIEGLKRAWKNSEGRRQVCGIGSVKSNIGHLEAASGLAGIAKVILAMQKGILPPTAGVTRPNDHIAFEDTPFFLIDHPTPWPVDHPLAGVSAFGMGGVNAHVILAPAPEDPPLERIGKAPEEFICKVSAATVSAVRRLAGLYARALKGLSAWDMADFCYTANIARSEFKFSIAVGGSPKQMITMLQSIECGETSVSMRSIGSRTIPSSTHPNMTESLLQKKEETAAVLADRYNQGKVIDWNSMYENEKYKLISIPTYPFNNQPYWVDNGIKM